LSEIELGLTLSGIGILITFAALGLLVLLILSLKWLFPEKYSGLDTESSPILEEGADLKRLQIRKRAAAAGVAALLYQEQEKTSRLGNILETPPSNWWKTGVNRNLDKENQ
jgi:hypothetical protein